MVDASGKRQRVRQKRKTLRVSIEEASVSHGSIRELGLDDYDRLLALWQRAGLHSLKPQGRDSREAMARQLASGIQTILGLEADGKLLGAVTATHDSRKGWINRLAVEPDCRRRGYGARLIAAAEEVLRDQGIRIIAALVESDNSASLALFRKVGYVDAGPGLHCLSKRDSDDV
jgi:ribosomal protein S18 acetylase RimI-like enzyme